ncbi:MAG TPA: CheR family methyltransferase [Gemmatimonadaceae bacterium]|jgi:two-component system CheB/CheR fusion protein
MARDKSNQDFEDLLELFKKQRGFDFTGYKRPTLVRRFRKRMSSVKVDTYADYMDLLLRDPEEVDHLFNTILINVTHFFRDTVPWQYLSEEIVPILLSSKRPEENIRVWSAGCATGQEAYSLAMLLAESLGVDEFLRRVKIYATDVDDDALNYARQARYTAREIEPVPELLRERYFDRVGSRYTFKKKLRRCIIFGRNDLVNDAPISKIDLLVCRNTLMYFESKTQARVLKRFHFALCDGGFLLLGKAETLTTHSSIFSPFDIQRRMFTKVPSKRKQLRGPELTSEQDATSPERDQLALLSNIAFDKSAVSQFVVDRAGNLALANDNAKMLFRLNAADIGRPIQDLELSYRPVELRSLLDQVHREERAVRLPDIVWTIAGDEKWFNVNLLPLFDHRRSMVGVSVIFDDISLDHALKFELERSHSELETAYEELQSSNEELETTNEELQSTVEEMETTNEELQSTNEELETMNEELQSTNEELGNINEELAKRGGQLKAANHFLEAVFASLRGGVAVVDPDMTIKVWNHRAEDLWGVRTDEVVNTPLSKLDIGLPLAEVRQMLLSAMTDGDHPMERKIPATSRKGKPIVCKVTVTAIRRPKHPDALGGIVVMEELPAEAGAGPR